MSALRTSENNVTRKVETGGPAFPLSSVVANIVPDKAMGMSLRDWFAGQALGVVYGNSVNMKNEDLAKVCYEIADTMIAERKKKL